MIDHFTKLINDILQKNFIIDVWQDPKYASDSYKKPQIRGSEHSRNFSYSRFSL